MTTKKQYVRLFAKKEIFDYETNTVFVGIEHITKIDVYLHEIIHVVGTEICKDKVVIGLNNKMPTY